MWEKAEVPAESHSVEEESTQSLQKEDLARDSNQGLLAVGEGVSPVQKAPI